MSPLGNHLTDLPRPCIHHKSVYTSNQYQW
nr:MAG TPA: hypothetical protein [Caudoviricetes sp.]